MANGGTVDLTLRVHSDVTEARKDIQSLQTSLQNLVTQKKSANPLQGLTEGATKAAHEIAELNSELQRSKNANGGLDAAKLAKIWQDNGKSLNYYKQQFETLGKDGQNAFNQLTQSIARAQAPMRELDGLIGKFAKGLLNTAMWTVQSNAIHGFQTAIKSATSYAKELNKGLTDIAIVSDLTSDKLAQFAKDANKYAQQYSTTTSEYVKGALIYYQQGLSGEEVIEKTNTTVKMANTSGETAEQISSYMTAIWNNFDDGSKSVEYFADVISYLGAETAASNADIAEGMQAFAATANTVGLSYEYAASALTTLRHVTQQSASTIGNSLKTIFARLSSVSLGETLEDNVDLTKYTKALADIGVNVTKANGDLKDMDSILDDLADRWDELTNAQKVAVAQTVGGVRQYNNLISLMDNYDYFKTLVEGSKQADGYLDKQNEKFEESWLGATNHIKTAVQKLYDILINDKFLIGLTNVGAKILDIVGAIIDKAGGLRTLLPLIISMLSTGINNSLGDILHTIQQITTTTFGWTKYNQQGIDLQALATNEHMKAAIPMPEGVKNPAQFESVRQQLVENTNELRKLIEDGAPRDAIEKLTLLVERDAIALQDYFKKSAELEQSIAELQKYSNLVSPYIQQAAAAGGALDFVNSENFTKTQYKDIGNTLAFFGLENSVDKSFDLDLTHKKFNGTKFNNRKELQTLLQSYLEDKLDSLDAEFNDAIRETLNKASKITKKTTSQTTKSSGGAVEAKNAESSANKDLKTTNNEVAESELSVADAQEEVVNKTHEVTEQKINQDKAEENVTQSIYEEKEALEATRQTMIQSRQDTAHQINAIIGVASAYLAVTSAAEKAYEGFEQIWNGQAEEGIKTIGSSLTAMTASIAQYMRALSILKMANKDLYDSFTAFGGAVGDVVKATVKLPVTLISTAISGGTATTAFAALGKATTLLTTKIGALISTALPIAAGATIIAGIAFAVKKLFEVWKESRPEQKLKRLQETSDALAESANKAEEAFDEVVTTLNGLDNKYEDLNKLTVGTQEWRNAVHELNKELLILVNKYGLVYGTHYTYENGAIHFTPEGERKLNEDASKNAQQSAKAAQVSDLATAAADYRNKTGAYYTNLDALLSAAEFGDKELAAQLNKTYGDPQLIEAILAEYVKDRNYNINKNAEGKYVLNTYGAAIDTTTTPKPTRAIDADILTQMLNSAAGLNSDNDYFSKQNTLFNEAMNVVAEEWGDKYGQEALAVLANKLMDEIIGVDTTTATVNELNDYAKTIGYQRKNGKYINPNDENATEITETSMQQMYTMNRALNNFNPSDYADLINNIFGTKRGTDHDVGSEAFTKNENAEMERYAEVVQKINANWEKYNVTAEEAKNISQDLATDYINFNKGLSDVIKNYENYITNLKEADTSSMDYINTIAELRNDLELMFEIDPSNLTDNFFSEHNVQIAKDLEAAAKGDFDALYDLQELIATNILPSAAQVAADLQDEYKTVIDNINNSEQWDDIQIGATFDSEGINQDFANAMEGLLASGEITAKQLQDTLDAIGWEPQIEWEEMTAKDAKDMHQRGYLKAGDEEPIPVDDWLHVDDETHVWVPKLIKNKTTYKGAPKARVNQSNRNAASKNAKSSSGGGSKQKTKEIDRYHEINSQIEQNTHLLDMVNTAEGRAYGPDKLHLMDEKIKLLERESELYKQLYDEAKAYYDADRARLANEFGAQFNEDGSIANYDKWFGAYIAKYNAGQMSDEQMQKLEDYIKKYEDSLKHLNDAEKKYQDDLNKIYDLKLEKIEYRLKTINKLIDQANDYLDHMIKQLDKSMYDTADVIALLGEKVGNVLQQAENERAAIGEIFANHGLSDEDIEAFISGQADIADILEKVGTLTEDEVSKLQEHQSALLKYSETLIQIREESYEKISESIDEFNEKIDHQIDIIKDLDGVMGHYKNIIDIVGKDVLGISDEMLKQMDQLAVTAAKSVVEISADQYNQGLAQLEAMRAREKELREQGLIEDADLMLKEIEAQEDRVMGFKEKFMGSWEDAENVIKTAFLNTIKLATDAFGEAMAGQAKTLDNLREYYDMQKTLQDRYLPTYQKIYELNKLTRDVNNAIDNTTNIAGKQRLLELQEDILKRQKEGVEVTEYEIGFLQRRLELEQARIAMEEAQNAKSMVRMTRDSEGNWSYTYTADSDKANAAKQNYEDKLYELKKYNQESLQSFQDALLQATEDYRRKIADLNLTDEERAKKIKEFQEDWVAHNKDMFQMAIDDAHWIIGEYNGGLDDLIDKFDETILAHETGFTDLEDYMSTFTEASNTMMTSVTGAYQQWQINNDLILEAAGTSVDNFKDKVLEDMKDIEEAMVGDEKGNGGAVNATKTLEEEMKSVFDDILKNLKNWFSGEGGYSSQIDSIAEKNKILYSSIQSLITQYNNLTKAATDYANTPQGTGPQGGGGTPGATGGNSDNNNGPDTEEDKPLDDGHWEWNDTKHWWVQQWSKTGTRHTKQAAHTFSHVPGAPSNVEKCTVCGYTHEKKNSGGGGSSGGGCFVAGTRITMANGSIQYIENIKIGDMVMAYNDETQEFEPREVTKSYIHHDTPAVINVYFEDGTVLGMTPGHPLLSTKGWKSRDIENSLYEHGTIATWLEVNDEIINLYHQTVKVTAIIKQNIPEHYDTYNIEVETCHTFIADGMVVHNMKMFDSGGYTGSFGPEGRIAVLHEKELVLNKADTENLLTTISFVRDLTRMISLNAAEAGNGLGNLFSTGVGQGGGFLDQNVTIHAEFPNATNHSEIEEAFSNLIGLASQYAGRRK